jgi:hypothetical protein
MMNDYLALQWSRMRYEELLRERKDERKMKMITLPKAVRRIIKPVSSKE